MYVSPDQKLALVLAGEMILSAPEHNPLPGVRIFNNTPKKATITREKCYDTRSKKNSFYFRSF
jgi:hypothetical protein